MTTRESVISTGLNAEHNYIKRSEHLHHVPNHQVKEENRKSETPKLSRRAVQGNKNTKPTMEIYRPPKNTQKNGAKVHFQTNLIGKGSPPPATPIVELKSALKRSKSFTGNDPISTGPSFLDKDSFPPEYHKLIRNAKLDPNLLSSHELMELVRLMCGKAVESIQNAQAAAEMCYSVIEKENGNTFLESLLTACREWFNERDKLLRYPFISSGMQSGHSGGGSRRWTAFVSFIMELYLRLRKKHQQMISLTQLQKTASASKVPTVTHDILVLLSLLYDCSLIILKPPSLNNVAEIECLRSVMVTIGKQLEADAPQRMQQVVSSLRDAFVNPSISAQIRKTLLELIELHASQWKLDLPQTTYYFPYTYIC